MDKDTFFGKFKQSEKGKLTFPYEAFISNYEKAAKFLTNRLDGSPIKRVIDKGIDRDQRADLLDQEVTKLLDLIPKGFFDTYGSLYRRDLQDRMVTVDGKIVKFSKILKEWMEENDRARTETEDLLDDYSRFLERIDKINGKNRSLTIEISNNLVDFLNLGHFTENEGGSCFRYGGINQVHKLIIAQTPGFFIVKIYDQSSRDTIIQRCIGYYSHDPECLVVTNFYGRNGLEPTEVLNEVLSIFYDKGIYKIPLSEKDIKINGIWKNSDAIGYIISPKTDNPTNIKIDCNCEDLDRFRKCYKCLLETHELFQVDRYLYCKECSQSAVTCGLSGVLTFRAIFYGIHPITRQKVRINEKYLKHFFECNDYLWYLRKESIKLPSDYNYSIFSLPYTINQSDYNKYCVCSYCKTLIHQDSLIKESECHQETTQVTQVPLSLTEIVDIRAKALMENPNLTTQELLQIIGKHPTSQVKPKIIPDIKQELTELVCKVCKVCKTKLIPLPEYRLEIQSGLQKEIDTILSGS